MAKYPSVSELEKMSEYERLAVFKKLPKVELHLHGDLAVPVNKLIDAYNEFSSADAEDHFGDQEIISNVLCNYKLSDLTEFVDKTRIICKLFKSDAKMLERCAYHTVMNKNAEGVVGLELRISPAFIAQGCGYSFDEVVTQFENGLQRAKKDIKNTMEAGYIYIGEIGIDNVFSFKKSVDYFLENRHRFIGFDNAGYEMSFEPFAAEFQRLKDVGTNITLHAGETPASPKNNILHALNCGAKRIGHGIEAAMDPEIMQRLKKDDIILEVCPKSNWITNSYITDMKKHPIRKLYDDGVKICISTDDPLMMGNTLADEYEILFKNFKFGCEDFMKMNTWALEKSFLSQESKKRLKEAYFPDAQI
ncbi:bifunctional Adenosine-adenine deaminase/Metal-dependent hydrolase/Adenosine deaminase domain [Babesia duncani]|uniref:adenosine deaminase n=1 Tax=Babesia duncani TaxID=323732 RepID=A0AAD9UQB2_9APIC|nr:bifunctional Adenosine-adenine deaminase/Metal-dependent hydrolase/Adenosine deaminase domain [Babesia duncani]